MKPINIKYIVVHCSATSPDKNIGFKEIDQMHVNRGWSGCGYHFVIRRDGSIEPGRPIEYAGAHAYGVNKKSWGICLVGGVDKNNKPENNFNAEQLVTLEKIIRGLRYRAPRSEVLGHRDLSPDLDGDGVIEKHEWVKDCPCFDVKKWWLNSTKVRGI